MLTSYGNVDDCFVCLLWVSRFYALWFVHVRCSTKCFCKSFAHYLSNCELVQWRSTTRKITWRSNSFAMIVAITIWCLWLSRAVGHQIARLWSSSRVIVQFGNDDNMTTKLTKPEFHRFFNCLTNHWDFSRPSFAYTHCNTVWLCILSLLIS